jgi:hypothetical protein
MKAGLIPPHIARLMNPEDRAKYLPGEAVGTEPAEQAKFAKYLKEQWAKGRLEYDWQRTDKRATARRGRPDFFVFLPAPQTLAIELKSAEGSLTPQQSAFLKNLAILGHATFIARSAAEAIRFVERSLYKQAQLALDV